MSDAVQQIQSWLNKQKRKAFYTPVAGGEPAERSGNTDAGPSEHKHRDWNIIYCMMFVLYMTHEQQISILL